MATPYYPPEVRTYISLMRQVKMRIAQLEEVFKGGHNLSKSFVRDLCFLQLRVMMEQVALACLVIHKDVSETRSTALLEAWQADYILKKLQKLHADFFPRPFVEEPDPEGEAGLMITEMEDGYLTHAEMLKLYRTCGDKLHWGSYMDIASGKKLTVFDVTTVKVPLARLKKLLQTHTIQSASSKSIYLVRLGGPSEPIKVARYDRNGDDGSGSVDLVRRVRNEQP